MQLPERNVIVYKQGSAGVSRAECPICHKTEYTYPKTLDEIIEELKENQKE